MSTATTHIKTDKQLVPALRFKEFEGDWIMTKVLDFAPLQRGFDLPVVQIQDGPYPVVFSNGALKTHSEFKAKAPGVVTGRSGTIGKVTFVEEDYWPHNTALWVTNFYENDPKYVYYFYINIKLDRYGTGSGVPTLNRNDVHAQKRAIPSLPEQQKIASFLSVVDEKIQQLTKKKELLEQYKKGVMQQLFPSTGSGQRSGQLRFKDANGKAYPDWEDTLLGDCLKYVQPTKYLVSSTKYDNSFETPVLTAGKTFVLGYTDEKENICTDYPLIIFDDFTTASKYVDFPFKAKSSAMKLLLAKEGVDVKFMFEAMQNIKFEVGGHGRHWISIFSQLVVSVPSINEQQKIATYLSSIDNKIESVNTQITQTQTFKKGLLQQMFV